MRFLFGILSLIFLTTPTRASVFHVNLNDLAITDSFICPGYCGSGPIYQKLSAQPETFLTSAVSNSTPSPTPIATIGFITATRMGS